ncbi:MAG: hypothetical protein ACOYNF_13510 [Rhodoferax sp.]
MIPILEKDEIVAVFHHGPEVVALGQRLLIPEQTFRIPQAQTQFRPGLRQSQCVFNQQAANAPIGLTHAKVTNVKLGIWLTPQHGIDDILIVWMDQFCNRYRAILEVVRVKAKERFDIAFYRQNAELQNWLDPQSDIQTGDLIHEFVSANGKKLSAQLFKLTELSQTLIFENG